MNSGLDMINELNVLSKALSKAIDEMEHKGYEYAEKESVYKVKLQQEALKLRDSGMAVGMIDKVVHGYCARERRDRDVAEAFYKTAQERINAIKLRMRLLDNQIDREWHKRGD